jgi:putative heme-binding domain-containing protein
VLFGSTANGNPSVYMPIPNRYYESVRGWSSQVLGGIAGNAPMYPITDKVRQVDWHGHFTAAAGHALYTARTYPRQYWNRTAFVAEPTGHLLATFVIEPQGADFRSRNAWNLLASDDEWCAPTMAEVGPDGNVWVIDWYAYIVQHNPTPPGFKTGKGNAYETELRDRKHGRIYRLVHKAGKPGGLTTLAGATPEKLVAALKNDNLFWRNHAQRLLVERGKKDIVPALLELVRDGSVDEIGLNPGAVHALWTLHGLGALDGDATAAAVAALKHKSAGVRRNAVQVLPREPRMTQAILASGVLTDPDAQVRLAAFLALAEAPAAKEVAVAITEALGRQENSGDAWLPDALTSAAAAHALPFLKHVASMKGAPPGRTLEVVGITAEHYARGWPADTIGSLVTTLEAGEPKAVEAIVAGLAKGWPRTKTATLGEDAEKAVARLLPRLAPGARGQLLRLAGTWGSGGLDKFAEETARSLLAVALDARQPDEQRVAAARQVAEFRADEATALKLLDAVTPQASPELASGLIEAVGQSASDRLPAALLERWAGWPPSARAAAVRVLLARPAATHLLLDALEKNKVQLGELTLEQKQSLAAHPDRRIASRARALLDRGGALPSPDRQKVIDELMPLTMKTGDAAAGKVVFKTHCAKCHTHTGEGTKIGPDLSGVAVHPKAHLLVEIMDPSRSVEGNYRQYNVTLKNGKILKGLMASESRTAIELIDVEAKRQAIQREDIEEILDTRKSLMPEGFEKQLKPEELVNLLEFLTQRGKYLPLPLDKVATVVSTRGMFNSEQSGVERLIFADWSPKTFQGVPFVLVDPQGDRVRNVVLLNGPSGTIPPKMPRGVTLPCNAPAKAIHLLSGVSGWGYPGGEKGSVSLIVRLHYADGTTEDHPLKNGEHFADYIRRVDVPGSRFAFALRNQQVRYLSITPRRKDIIKEIELVKGTDRTAPVVMAVTVEAP